MKKPFLFKKYLLENFFIPYYCLRVLFVPFYKQINQKLQIQMCIEVSIGKLHRCSKHCLYSHTERNSKHCLCHDTGTIFTSFPNRQLEKIYLQRASPSNPFLNIIFKYFYVQFIHFLYIFLCNQFNKSHVTY